MLDNIPLPNQGTAYEFAGIQYLLAKKFGEQIFHIFDSRFRMHNVSTWFQQIQQRRKKDSQPIYDDATDPRFLLKEATFWNSEFRLVAPELDSSWDINAKKLISTLNNWSHQKMEPTPDAFLNLLVQLESVCTVFELDDFLSLLDSLIDRTKAIRNGAWVPESIAAQMPGEAAKFAGEVSKKLEDVKSRPPVGHEWIGEPGQRIIELRKSTREVYENGVSIRSELGVAADSKIESWLRYYPQGGRLRVDTDGAVLGFKQGVGYLVGWFGEDPTNNPDSSTGFYLQKEYEFTGEDVCEVGTGILLSSVASESITWIISALQDLQIANGATLNVSNYGDLIFQTDSGDEVKVAHIHKDVWFPGHLLEE